MDNTKVINGTTYSFGTIPPLEAVRIEVSIARVVGEPLFKAAMDVKGKGKTADGKPMTKEAMFAAAASAIGMLTSRMDADELIDTIKTVMKYTSAGKERVNIDQHFNGKNAEMWQVFIEGLRYNFADFFTGSLFDSIKDQIPKLS